MFAIIVTLATLWLRLALSWQQEGPVIIIFVIPIILSGYWGGLGPGLAATAVAFLGTTYYLLSPVHSFLVTGTMDRWLQLLLISTGALISVICETLHRARLRPAAMVAELQAAQDDLRHSLKETGDLRTALDEHAIVAITDSRGKIVFVNDKFCAISQYSREELIGQDHRVINSGHHPKEFIRGLWTTIARGEVWHGELENRAKDGTFYWVDTTIVPFLDERGKPRQYVAIRADITERKRAQETAGRMHAVEEANRMKSEFLANMSHELRTPLNGIIGFGEVLLAGRPGPTTAKQREFLTDMLNSGRHLQQLINDVLDLAKVEAGKMEFTPETFAVAKALAEVCAVSRGIAENRKIEICIEPGEDVTVTLDQPKFKQVLYNLISNAVKFNSEGGRVAIAVRAAGSARFRVRIRDNGIGIPSADFPRLFREFEQLDSGAARRFGGTGLGLALTKKILEIQGGTIEVESALGVGSTFTIELPRAHGAGPPGP